MIACDNNSASVNPLSQGSRVVLKRTFVLLVALALVLGTTGWRSVDSQPAPGGRLLIVKMVELSATYRYQPATATVNPGDTVRFVQTSAMPHNVEFTKTPSGAKLGSAKMGPYLTAPGQTYDVVIDTRFPDGQYRYMCTPHFALGMLGVIVVAARQ